MEITVSIIQLGLTLIIIGLLLNNWEPPIKDQYTFIILAIVGMGLGYVLNCGIHWGFIGAGLVFYKGKLVEEFRLVKDSLIDLKNEEKKTKEE
jgi:hypothetical protein